MFKHLVQFWAMSMTSSIYFGNGNYCTKVPIIDIKNMMLDEIRPMIFFWQRVFFQQKYWGKIGTFFLKCKTTSFFWGVRGREFSKKNIFKKLEKNTKGYYEYIMCYFEIILGFEIQPI
jgi:hypothetical protein